MPRSGNRVIFCWLNEQERRRTSMGFYANSRDIEADWDAVEDYDGLDEDDRGVVWLTEGWYEAPAEGGPIHQIDGVTHWMPRPMCPEE